MFIQKNSELFKVVGFLAECRLLCAMLCLLPDICHASLGQINGLRCPVSRHVGGFLYDVSTTAIFGAYYIFLRGGVHSVVDALFMHHWNT